jgi:hypothetical protein
MPNALNQGVFRSYYAGKDDAAAQQQQNALGKMRQTQFDQDQQDRQRRMMREDILPAVAAITMAEREQRPVLWGQIVPELKAKHRDLANIPDQYDEAAFVRFLPQAFGPEMSAKIIAERFAPSPQNPISVSPGTTLVDPQTRQPFYTNPSRVQASGRPIPVVDSKSPTGFSYQTPEGAVGQPAPAPRSPSNTRYSQREMQAARDKLRLIGLAKQQLQNVKNRWRGEENPETGQRAGGIKGTASAGFLQGWVPTEGGDRFDAAVSQLTPALAAITRVPGVGAMSDYETRLQEAARPQRGRFEATTDDQISGVELLLDQLEAGYGGILQDGAELAGGPDLNQSVEDLVEYYAGQD